MCEKMFWGMEAAVSGFHFAFWILTGKCEPFAAQMHREMGLAGAIKYILRNKKTQELIS